MRALPAHPRACGENERVQDGRIRRLGSSPRVRGKRSALVASPWRSRLIPACAGKTPVLLCPRPRGDGSSPRVRGKRSALVASPWRSRLIPACAGKTPVLLCPRPRGDGSSPRVRGKPVRPGQSRCGTRLIPACAGKTRSRGWPRGRSTAHPRVCGENARSARMSSCPLGSSPRVRGKLPRHRHQHRPGRLIPACAGKTDHR